jgi:hypothetical protein
VLVCCWCGLVQLGAGGISCVCRTAVLDASLVDAIVRVMLTRACICACLPTGQKGIGFKAVFR